MNLYIFNQRTIAKGWYWGKIDGEVIYVYFNDDDDVLIPPNDSREASDFEWLYGPVKLTPPTDAKIAKARNVKPPRATLKKARAQ